MGIAYATRGDCNQKLFDLVQSTFLSNVSFMRRLVNELFKSINQSWLLSGQSINTLLGPLYTVCRHKMSDEPNIRIWLSEQKRLESSAEGRQKRCRRNLRWQAVPHLRASNRKCSAVNGGAVNRRLDEAVAAGTGQTTTPTTRWPIHNGPLLRSPLWRLPNNNDVPGRVKSRKRELRRRVARWRIQCGGHVTVGEEVRRVDVVQSRTSGRLQRQKTADEIARRHGHVRRKRVLVVYDPHVRFFECGRLERRTSAQ